MNHPAPPENAPQRPAGPYNEAIDEQVKLAAELIGPVPPAGELNLAEYNEYLMNEVCFWKEEAYQALELLGAADRLFTDILERNDPLKWFEHAQACQTRVKAKLAQFLYEP